MPSSEFKTSISESRQRSEIQKDCNFLQRLSAGISTSSQAVFALVKAKEVDDPNISDQGEFEVEVVTNAGESTYGNLNTEHESGDAGDHRAWKDATRYHVDRDEADVVMQLENSKDDTSTPNSSLSGTSNCGAGHESAVHHAQVHEVLDIRPAATNGMDTPAETRSIVRSNSERLYIPDTESDTGDEKHEKESVEMKDCIDAGGVAKSPHKVKSNDEGHGTPVSRAREQISTLNSKQSSEISWL